MPSISTRLLLTWFLCVVAGTLAPFHFTPPAGMEHGFKLFEFGALERDPVHFAFNLLMFMPLGVLLHHEARRRSVVRLPIVLVAGLTGFLISMTVEFGQAFLPSRDSSLIDVMANVAGSLIGVAADRRWGTPATAGFIRARAATSPTMLAGLIGGFLAVAVLFSGTLQAGARLSNWNPGYPLLVGNEQTGDRPWRGRVFALDITDAATPAVSVRRFAAGEPVEMPGTALAAFVFDGSAPYQDASGNLPNLEWTERQAVPGGAGVSLPGRFWLRSRGAASGLAQRLGQTNAFTLRVRCATDDVHQEGPARIISNSVNSVLRNFTLGQQGRRLVFRLRTPDTGVNGSLLEVYVPEIFADGNPREILATYDGATLLVAVADTAYVSSTELTPGASVALAFPSLEVRPEQLPIYEMAYVGAMSLFPGALIGFLARTNRQRRVLSIAWALAFAVLLEATIVRVSGSAFDWADVGRAAGIGAVVLSVVNAIFSGADGPSEPAGWIGSLRRQTRWSEAD